MVHDSEVEFVALSFSRGVFLASFRMTEKDGVESWEGSAEKEGEALEVSGAVSIGAFSGVLKRGV